MDPPDTIPPLGLVSADALSLALEKHGITVPLNTILETARQVELDQSTDASSEKRRAAMIKGMNVRKKAWTLSLTFISTGRPRGFTTNGSIVAQVYIYLLPQRHRPRCRIRPQIERTEEAPESDD